MKLRFPILSIAAATLALSAFSACEDDGNIGTTLLEDQVEIIVDSTFTVSGSSVKMCNVRPRTIDQYIGSIDIPHFGRISSSVAAQFLPSVELDTANYTAESVDSIYLNFRYLPGAFIGDSIVPMGIAAYPLSEVISGRLYTDSPLPKHSSESLGRVMFSPSTLGNDSLAKISTRTVSVKLPRQFGRDLYQAYTSDPLNYSNGDVFTDKVFKGFYIDTYFGTGRLMQFARTTMTLFMHYTTKDEEGNNVFKKDEYEYYCVSPELVNNNYINVELDSELKDKAESGTPMLIAPASYNVRMRFPAPEIITAYRNHGGIMAVLNNVSLSIPADTISSDGLVGVPQYVLMVLEKDLDEFFNKNKVPDNKTSFYATYTSGAYSFSGLGTYINDLLERDGEITEEDYTFCLVPVSISFEQDVASMYYSSPSYIVADVTPYIQGPVAGILDFENAKVKLTYSRQVAL